MPSPQLSINIQSRELFINRTVSRSSPKTESECGWTNEQENKEENSHWVINGGGSKIAKPIKEEGGHSQVTCAIIHINDQFTKSFTLQLTYSQNDWLNIR